MSDSKLIETRNMNPDDREVSRTPRYVKESDVARNIRADNGGGTFATNRPLGRGVLRSKSRENMILVTGATGNVGRNVVSQLARTGAHVRALTRNPDAARLPDGVNVMRGDLSVPSTLRDCLEGGDTVFLVWRNLSPAIVPALIDELAKRVRRIVFLSSSAVRDDLETQADAIGKIH